jgi:serine/threonine protein kinase/tetratricopeptide (TPR) repeat protein
MPQVRAAARPTTLGHYTLIERLGAGGQGEVWKAHDESRGVDVALKVLAPSAARNPAAWEALEREHAISSRLQHPGILQVLPPERIGDAVVLPMELAAGGDLRRLRGTGYLEIVPALLEAAEALEYAHARGVVHRDLKAGNVLLDSRGRVKLADFGIAALLPAADAGTAQSRSAGHSPFTASPEQLRGEPPSAGDDIYGLGALAYELLSGHPPYYPNFDLRRAQTQPVPELVPTRQVPPELGELVMRMLSKCAADRPASMQQVMDELDATLNATLSFAPEGVEARDADEDGVIPAQPAGPAETAPRAPATSAPVAAAPAICAGPAESAAPLRPVSPEPQFRRSSLEPDSAMRADSPRPVPAAGDAATHKPAPPHQPATTAPSADPPQGPPAAPVYAERRAQPVARQSNRQQPAARRSARNEPIIRPPTPSEPTPLEAAPPHDPFDIGDDHPRLRAMPPPRGRRSSPAAAARPGRHWPYLVSGLLCGAVLICAATVAALFWLPRQDLAGLQPLLGGIAAVTSLKSPAEPAAAKPQAPPPAARPPSTPRPDPAALARLASERADFDKRATALQARGAAVWDGAEFSQARMQAAESSGAAAAGGIPIALQHLQQAEQLLASVARKAPQALAAQLQAGDDALAAGHRQAADQAFTLARRINPNSQRAIEGSRRARLLSGVLPLLADARRAESARNYSRAAQDFSQALALDPGNTVAREGLARANAAFGDDSYARAVGAGFAALGAGKLTEAQTDFKQALQFRPHGTEATEGLQRVGAAMQAGRVAALRQQAASLEEQEHWRQAAAVYATLSNENPSLTFARQDEARDQARAQLTESLQAIIDHPDELTSPSVRDEAVALLQEAREETHTGPVLQAQVERVAQLLPLLDRPVRLNLVSDNATQVTIPSIGVFGTFGRREIQLKPGTYTVIGTRDGYRAVHQEFTVEPGQQSETITVSCSEPI